MTEEAKLTLEAVVVALEMSNPDIKTIREMLREADALLSQAATELCALPQGGGDCGGKTPKLGRSCGKQY